MKFGIILDSVIDTDEIEISFIGEGSYGKVYKAVDEII